MGKTLRRYVAREVLGGFLAGLVLFTFVLLVARILDLVDLVLVRGVPAGQVVRLVGYILPSFLEIAIPLSVLLGVVTAFGRLSSDGELLAMRAAGVSLWQVLPVACGFGLLASAATFVTSAWGSPWAQRNVSGTLYEIAKTRATAAIRPSVFNSIGDGVVLFVESVDDSTGTFRGVLLADERNPMGRTTVVASTARLLADERSKQLFLSVADGTSFTTRARDSYDTTAFGRLDVTLDLARAAAAGAHERKPEQMYPSELLAARAAAAPPGRAAAASVELHRRASFAAAALVLAIAGVPLGMRPSRSVRARGLATSLAVVLTYYVGLTLAVALARRGALDGALAMWMPDLVLGLAAVAMLARAAADRAPLPPLGRLLRIRPARGLVHS